MRRKGWFIFFATLDIATLGLYLHDQIIERKIPFFSDLLNLYKVGIDYGSITFVFTLSIPVFIVYLTMFISIYFYLTQHQYTKWLTLFQLPLRVFSVIPSIPLLFIWLKNWLNNINVNLLYNVLILFSLLLAIETLKVSYLFHLDKDKNNEC